MKDDWSLKEEEIKIKSLIPLYDLEELQGNTDIGDKIVYSEKAIKTLRKKLIEDFKQYCIDVQDSENESNTDLWRYKEIINKRFGKEES